MGLGLIGCHSPLIGNAPERPPPDSDAKLSDAPHVDAQPGDIDLEAFDKSAAEEAMQRRCPNGYAISGQGTIDSTTCRPPRSNAAPTTTRCSPHQDVTYRFRCTDADAGT